MAVVRTSDEARERWTEFARRHGVSVSALLEAISLDLPAVEQVESDPRMQAAIAEARAIDADRRRRD